MLYTEEAIKNRKNKIANIKNKIKITVYIILLPLLVYNISLIFQAIANPNKTPAFFGIKTYVIVSGSMYPNLDIGDIVVVKEHHNELNKGDIISFRRGQAIITHRIIDVINEEGKTKYITKGDNNNVEDTGNISIEKVEGKVVGKIPLIGKITLVLKNKMSIITIVILYYIYLLHEQSLQKRKEIRKFKRQEYENNKNERRENDENAKDKTT